MAALLEPMRMSDSEPVSASDAIPILIVEDSNLMSLMVANHVKSLGNYDITIVSDGTKAIDYLRLFQPAIVLTDLHMPEMDGLQLVEYLRENYPQIPVILMTAQGSEDIAMQALRAGASSYVTKKSLRRDLGDILDQVISNSKKDRRRQTLLQSLHLHESEYVLENDPSLVPLLITMFQEELSGMGICRDANRTRIGVALEEALLNAIYHGNLQVSSDLKRQDGNQFHELAERRRFEEPFCSRRVYVRTRLTRETATFMIRDQGPGFDISKLPDPLDPANLEKPSGRGLLLIRAFLDDVRHNSTGNEITLVKHRDE